MLELRRPSEARSDEGLRRVRALVLKFRGCRDAFCNVPSVILDQLLRCASLISLADGHALFTAGQRVGWCFVLLAGRATVRACVRMRLTVRACVRVRLTVIRVFCLLCLCLCLSVPLSWGGGEGGEGMARSEIFSDACAAVQ